MESPLSDCQIKIKNRQDTKIALLAEDNTSNDSLDLEAIQRSD